MQWLDDRISQWRRDVQVPMSRQLQDLTAKVDEMKRRLEAVEHQHLKDRENFPKMIEQRR